MRLLLVEDEKRMAQALCEILRFENYDVDHYEDGISGLAAAESGVYDMMILDVMLPGMNGYEIARLSEKEYRILEYMISNRGQILTREQLAVKIWGFESDAEYNNVEVYMSFTRKKLAFVGSETVIKAVRGVGYELRYGDV